MKKNVYYSAVQVTVFSTIEKTLSFCYRIVLSRAIGAEGVGIYQLCLSVFAVFLTAASSGIPITVSRLIAKQSALGNEHEKHAVVTAGVVSTLFFTVPSFFLLMFGRTMLSPLFSDDRAADVFLYLVPGLIITSIYAVMRGAFWGNKQFVAYSVIELAEDAVMVILGCTLIFFSHDPVDGATKATVAVLVSYVFSFLVSLWWYGRCGGKFVAFKHELRPLLSSALPVTAMRTLSSLLGSLVGVLLPLLLVRYGAERSDAMAQYGVLMAMTMPILYIPLSLIGSISVVAAPQLSEHFYANRKSLLNADVKKTINAASLIACVTIPPLLVLGDEIGVLLYNNELSGRMIALFSPMMLPMCISVMTTTVLNSMNCEKRTLLYFCLSAGLDLICVGVLTKWMGIYSYPTGIAIGYVLTAALNLKALNEKCEGVLSKQTWVWAICCAFLCVLGKTIKTFLYHWCGGVWGAALVILCVFALEGVVFFSVGGLKMKDVKKYFFAALGRKNKA